MPIGPITGTTNKVWVSFNSELAQCASQWAAEAGSQTGGPEVQLHGSWPQPNQTGGHPSYGWRHAHLVQTRNDQLLLLANYAARPVYYDGPDAQLRGFGEDLGRPAGWSRTQEPMGTAWESMGWSNMDLMHCRLGPLFEMCRPETPDFPINFFGQYTTKQVAAFLLICSSWSEVGQARQPWVYQGQRNLLNTDPVGSLPRMPDRAHGLMCDLFAQGWPMFTEAQQVDILRFTDKVLELAETGCGAHFFDWLTFPNQRVMQPLDSTGYLVSGLWSIHEVNGIAPTLKTRIETIIKKRANWACQGWQIGQPWPYFVAVNQLPLSPPDMLTISGSSFDPTTPVAYAAWCYRTFSIGEKLGVAGCAERRAWIYDNFKNDPSMKPHLITADREYATE